MYFITAYILKRNKFIFYCTFFLKIFYGNNVKSGLRIVADKTCLLFCLLLLLFFLSIQFHAFFVVHTKKMHWASAWLMSLLFFRLVTQEYLYEKLIHIAIICWFVCLRVGRPLKYMYICNYLVQMQKQKFTRSCLVFATRSWRADNSKDGCEFVGKNFALHAVADRSTDRPTDCSTNC